MQLHLWRLYDWSFIIIRNYEKKMQNYEKKIQKAL